jgi:hypothetical protein
MRRRRSAGLTYFFFPRGLVADRREEVLFDDTEDFLGDVVWDLADGALAIGALPAGCAGFLVLCVVEVAVEPVELGACWSNRFPSAGTAANKAQSAVATSRAGPRMEKGEKTGCIVSL